MLNPSIDNYFLDLQLKSGYGIEDVLFLFQILLLFLLAWLHVKLADMSWSGHQALSDGYVFECYYEIFRDFKIGSGLWIYISKKRPLENPYFEEFRNNSLKLGQSYHNFISNIYSPTRIETVSYKRTLHKLDRV